MEWSKVFLSNLKLRGSYGNIGNQSIEPYALFLAWILHWLIGL